MRMIQGKGWLILAAALCLAVLCGEFAWTQSFTWTLKKREKNDKVWVFTCAYPELSSSDALMGTKGIVRDFNDRMKNDVDREEKSFLKNMNEDMARGLTSSVISKYTVKCTIVAETPRYASFKFDHLDCRSNLAHPDINYSTINWTTDGKFLTIEDLGIPGKKFLVFLTIEDLGIPGKKFLEKLSAESEKILKAQFAKEGKDPLQWGLEPTAKNFRYFCLSREGLKIYFSYYQLGSRPMGAPEIMIPWSSLEGVLSPKAKELIKSGMLKRCLADGDPAASGA